MEDFAFDLKLLGPLVNDLITDLSKPAGWWAAGVVAVCLLVSFGAANVAERRLAAGGRGGIAIEWAQRVVWPIAALLLLLAARGLLGRVIPVTLLSVVIALLVSLAVIRTLVLILRQTFSAARWVATFERSIALVIWVLVALHVLDLLPLLVETMESIAIPIGKSRLTLLQAVTGVFTVGLATVIALWASRAIDSRLERAEGVDHSARAVIGRIATPVLMTIALLIALPMVGIDLTTLSVFGGALGVGLGLGMQRIAANYVSGFIILLDKSIEPGRLVRVDKWRGIVADIRTRYTVLRGLDGVDSIVPNEMMVASVVESETFTNTTMRAALRVSIAYGSDVDRAMAILVELASEQPRILADPAPMAFVVELADSAIVLELGFWIQDPTNGTLLLRSEINRGLLRRYRDEGIEIPFPQREVLLRRPARAADADGPRPHAL